MSDPAPEPIYFQPGQLDDVAALMRAWACPPDDIVRWLEIEPVDLPEHLLPETKGFLGRRKQTERPAVQVIYLDPTTVGGASTINVSAAGRNVGDDLRTAGIQAPEGAEIAGNRDAVMVLVDVGTDTDAVVRFAVEAIMALVPGWDARFRATVVTV